MQQNRVQLLWLLVLFAILLTMTSRAEISLTQAYSISRFELRGNTVLPPDAVNGVLTNAMGAAVPLRGICQALAALRREYETRGYAQARISLPEQLPANGVVVVDVVAGHCFAAAVCPSPAATNQPAAAAMKFAVRRFEVAGNTLLPPAEIERLLQPGTGPAVTLEAIRQAAAGLQHAYRERGYATVAVSLPAQRLTNAVVHLVVTEGRLAAIQIAGNRHFSSENILRALPDLQTNLLLNGHVFQRELDQANENRDRQIYPALGPGPDPGTTALTLRVQDRLPLHAHLEADNYATPGTPDLRVNFAAQYDNFWQREQQAGLAYSFTPEGYKSINNAPDFGLNQPLVASYSVFYRIPIPNREPLAEPLAAPGFGYQEATHQFRLPPTRAEAELSFYASASASDTGVRWGEPSTITQSALLTINSQDSQQSLANNENVGSQFRFPLFSGEHVRLTGWVGVDIKQTEMAGYGTNNFFLATTTTNLLGSQTNQSVASKGAPRVSASAAYVPVNLGVDFSESDRGGSTAATLALSGNCTGSDADFARLAYSSRAQSLFGKALLTARREVSLPGGCGLVVRASGQAAGGALIGNEQFALGGVDSVRGYYEGDQYGDCGWTGTVELRSPYLPTQVALVSRLVPAWLRASLFTDGGQRILLESSGGVASRLWLWGVGAGLSANVNHHLDARMSVAWPLLPTPDTARDEVRAYFSIGGQF